MRSLVLLAVAAYFSSWALAGDFPRTIKPALVWTGTESQESKPSLTRCLTQDEWEAVWRKHHGGSIPKPKPCPKVAFDSHMVVALFQGSSEQDNGLDVVEVAEGIEGIRLRFRPLSYQVGFVGGPGAIDWKQYRTRSFAFVVLPRSNKPLVIEEDVRGLIAAPPSWEVRAKFAAVKEK